MPRSVTEWIGKDDNARAPKRVRDRLLARHPACYLCSRPFVAGEKIDFDHITALINGGENRESNLRPVHQKCHVEKTRADVAEKARITAKRQKHQGIVDPPKMEGRPFQTTRKAFERKKRAKEKLPLPPRQPLYTEMHDDAQ